MKPILRLLLTIVFLVSTAPSASAQPALAEGAMVATVHPLATEAGLYALREGGNAVDAAVAAALTLGVVDGYNSGIGGGCFILIHRADGELFAIDGRETAPALATVDMYLRDGKPRPELSTTGPLASGVPGALAAYERAVARHGQMSLKELLLPAAALAERGFAINQQYAARLAATADVLRQFKGSRDVLLKPDGSPYAAGEVLRQPDLARTYRAIAEEGADWFYEGPLAERVGQWMAEHGGILSAEDFAAYQAVDRQPLRSKYRGHEIIGFPPPSSGGVHVAQILNILEHFDLGRLSEQNEATRVHVMAEAMKLAFADRAHWLGDPDFAQVPLGLVAADYGQQLAGQVDLQRATEVKQHGQPPQWDSRYFGRHTTHIAAADAEGNWVAITATINTTFGSKVIVPGTGVILNNEMDDFSIQPGQPNAFGLIGAAANRIEPGKRPLSSMSPTIVLRDGQPVLTIGAAGGPKIITQVVLSLGNYIDLGMGLPDAVAAPRFHHQWVPDRLYVEDGLLDELRANLQRLGHQVETTDHVGVTQAIARPVGSRQFIGVSDPRVQGAAAGLGTGARKGGAEGGRDGDSDGSSRRAAIGLRS